MAIVEVTISKGRSLEVKEKIIAGITDVMIDAIGAEPRQVRVVIREVEDGCYGVAGKPIFLNLEADQSS